MCIRARITVPDFVPYRLENRLDWRLLKRLNRSLLWPPIGAALETIKAIAHAPPAPT